MIQVHEKSGMSHTSGRTEGSNLNGGTPALLQEWNMLAAHGPLPTSRDAVCSDSAPNLSQLEMRQSFLSLSHLFFLSSIIAPVSGSLS